MAPAGAAVETEGAAELDGLRRISVGTSSSGASWEGFLAYAARFFGNIFDILGKDVRRSGYLQGQGDDGALDRAILSTVFRTSAICVRTC